MVSDSDNGYTCSSLAVQSAEQLTRGPAAKVGPGKTWVHTVSPYDPAKAVGKQACLELPCTVTDCTQHGLEGLNSNAFGC
jgi:hypothetical protein